MRTDLNRELARLGDKDRDVRAAAAHSLGKLQAAEAAAPLVRAMAAKSVPRAIAGQALIAIGPGAAAALRPLLDDEDTEVRRAAAEVLGLVGEPADAAALSQAARDPDAGVRATALRALGKAGGPSESETARAALQDRVPFVRTNAAHTAARIGDRRLVGDLIAQARGDAHDPAAAAARALVALDPAAALTAAEQPGAGPHLRQAATRARSALA